ncbi:MULTISPECIES: hypothetical protein [unclassified Streptomyces]|uniref:hypothetical protein n=1 Tax=unclassified Streptomyces TaxID=2593676 RepID=UPI0010570A8C
MAEPRTGRPDPAARRIASTAGDGVRTLADAAAGRRPEAGGQAAHEGPAVTTRPPDSGAGRRWRSTDVAG